MRRGLRQSAWTVLVCTLVGLITGGDVPASAPWRARRRPGVFHNRLAAARVNASHWGQEPQSPASVDPTRFSQALKQLCISMPKGRELRYATWILQYAAEFSIDPFLLGALVYREGRCNPDKEELGGIGLTLIVPGMYQSQFRDRAYHYRVKVGDDWQDRALALPKFVFGPLRLREAEANLYFAAALLSVWQAQHATIDASFPQVPHRHFVSHWVWGDKVTSDRAEDRILTDRRRLLEYYGERAVPSPITRQGMSWGPPLDGAPRVVSSGLGHMREGGDRNHRGVDVESEFGEPVRAVAPGRVIFAGVDLPGHRHNQILPPEEINTYERRALGSGGRYVCLRHERQNAEPLRSCYMHLETVEVAAGDSVVMGQRIGSVGRTGMLRSSPHLHLEILDDRNLYDGLEVLRGHLIGEPIDPDAPRRKRRRRANHDAHHIEAR